MVFSSLFFLCIFLPICLGLYYINKNRTYRNWLLIITSLIFYAWGEPVWISILLLSTGFSYFSALLAEKYRGNVKGKIALIASIAGNLLILGFFKYSGFLIDNINGLIGTSIKVPEVGLPIGISFYTFKIISYIVDVYKGETEAQKSPFKLLLYVSLFHQLMAGPITRYKDISEAIDNRVETYQDFNYGVSRFIIGLGKKVILAGTAGKITDIFMGTDYTRLPLLGAWFGILMFALQLYFDFSGYSDMALGLGSMFGFKYKENFDYPYISKSAGEFWRRWHISLGSFFRDYVYIPLGGNRKFRIRNLFIVWGLTGLWHGADWNFIIWGLYYFVLLVIEKAFLLKLFEKLPAIISRLYLWVAVLVGWVFFYHNDIGQAFRFLGIMFGPGANGISSPELSIHFWNNAVFLIIALIGCTPVFSRIFKRLKEEGSKGKLIWFIETYGKPAFNIAVLVLSVIFLVGQSFSPFMYFKF
ncbi:MAG TPA: MBOAT family protein [Clostridiaceae bacterium]|nr:MBOAT family protein [Clostridiaceae bacterium]